MIQVPISPHLPNDEIYCRIYASRLDGVEAAWRIVQPILGTAIPVIEYEPGRWGPKEADDLIASHGGWVNPEAG